MRLKVIEEFGRNVYKRHFAMSGLTRAWMLGFAGGFALAVLIFIAVFL